MSETVDWMSKYNELLIEYMRDLGVMTANYDWICEVTGESVDDPLDIALIELARSNLKSKMNNSGDSDEH